MFSDWLACRNRLGPPWLVAFSLHLPHTHASAPTAHAHNPIYNPLSTSHSFEYLFTMTQIRGTAGYNLGLNNQFGQRSNDATSDPSPLDTLREQTSKIEDWLNTMGEPLKPYDTFQHFYECRSDHYFPATSLPSAVFSSSSHSSKTPCGS